MATLIHRNVSLYAMLTFFTAYIRNILQLHFIHLRVQYTLLSRDRTQWDANESLTIPSPYITNWLAEPNRFYRTLDIFIMLRREENPPSGNCKILLMSFLNAGGRDIYHSLVLCRTCVPRWSTVRSLVAESAPSLVVSRMKKN